MKFADIPTGTTVFLDANVLIYHFIAEPRFGSASTALLERIERQDVAGVSSTALLAEISHRLMTLEACERFGWPYQGIAARLRSHPDFIKQLHRFSDALGQIPKFGLRVVPVTEHQVAACAVISRQSGLMTNDALIVAVMQSEGITNLASNDADFDRVPNIARYAPT